MQELIQFFIDQASIDPNHLTGMVAAGIVLVGMGMLFIGYIFDRLLDFFRGFKPIKINKVQKVNKVVEVPKYTDNSAEISEILKKVKELEKNQKEGVKL